jgi:hypothetical protein
MNMQLLLEDKLIDKELKVMVLGGTGHLAEEEVGLHATFLGHGVVCEGIIVDNSEVVLPGETLHLLVESGSK